MSVKRFESLDLGAPISYAVEETESGTPSPVKTTPSAPTSPPALSLSRSLADSPSRRLSRLQIAISPPSASASSESPISLTALSFFSSLPSSTSSIQSSSKISPESFHGASPETPAAQLRPPALPDEEWHAPAEDGDDQPDWLDAELRESISISATLPKVDRLRVKRHPIKNKGEYEALFSINPAKEDTEMQKVTAEFSKSPLGKFLQARDYTVVTFLHMKFGGNSYFILLRDRDGNAKLLKINKIKEWDVPHLRGYFYSEQRGDASVLRGKHEHLLAPDLLISHGITPQGKPDLMEGGQEGAIVVAQISDFIMGAQELQSKIAKKELSYLDVRKLFSQILKSVSSLKAVGITHRDLNPSNFLIDSEDQVKLIDFGCAIQTEDGSASAPHEGGEYAAPKGEVSNKLDEFSLGLILFAMCTGINPGAQDSLAGKSYKDYILGGLLPFCKDVPDDLTQIMSGLLELDPQERMSVDQAMQILEL